LLALLKKLGWLQVDVYQNLYRQAEEISKMLSGLISSLAAEH
jgi:four helix bundle protein